MKTKIVSVFSAALLISAGMFSVASAQDLGVTNVRVNADVQLGAEVKDNSTTSTKVKTAERVDATSTNAKDGRATSTTTKKDNATGTTERDGNSTSTATSTNENTNGQLNAEEHRSTVASFVKSLLSVADREGGIGAEVRAIAQAQNDSATTSEDAITKVESKGKISTFFFGSDYKNLGKLRSEIATTQNNIGQLNNLLAKATSTADKVVLAAQIKVLEDSQVKVDAFVNAHENSFSLFGWFVKWFAK